MTLIQEYPFTETSVLFNVNRGDSDKIWKEFRETPGAPRIYVVHQRKQPERLFSANKPAIMKEEWAVRASAAHFLRCCLQMLSLQFIPDWVKLKQKKGKKGILHEMLKIISLQR